ncbi:hypothetical protein EJB05_37104, partial [Eragrostis curvula]
MLVVEVDTVDAETPEAALARGAHIHRVTTDLPLAVDKNDTELGGQLHLLPHPALQRLLTDITSNAFSANHKARGSNQSSTASGNKPYLAEEDLVGVGAVDVGGVKEGDAGGNGVVNERGHLGLGLGRAVDGGHAHAAEALRRDLQALGAQLHARHIHWSSGHGREAQDARLCSWLSCVTGKIPTRLTGEADLII